MKNVITLDDEWHLHMSNIIAEAQRKFKGISPETSLCQFSRMVTVYGGYLALESMKLEAGMGDYINVAREFMNLACIGIEGMIWLTRIVSNNKGETDDGYGTKGQP